MSTTSQVTPSLTSTYHIPNIYQIIGKTTIVDVLCGAIGGGVGDAVKDTVGGEVGLTDGLIDSIRLRGATLST